MKNFIRFTVLLIAFSFNSLFAQEATARKPEKKIPLIVEEAFRSKFAEKEPVWFSQYQGRYDDQLVYEARFIFDKRYSAAVYNREGALVAFAATIETSEIPQQAVEYMHNKYPYQPIIEALTVSRENKDPRIELGIYIGTNLMVFVFDKEGLFIETIEG